MKPHAFEYFRPAGLEEALELLERFQDEAQILAGGQSLVPMMNMRLSSPAALIDINRIGELAGIEERGDKLRVGALARYADIAGSPLVAHHAPLLGLAIPHIAHPAIRNRGTIGGSLSLWDPAAELPACCVASGAEIVLQGSRGRRTVPAGEFSTGLYETVRRPDEILVEVLLPKAGGDRLYVFDEFSRRRGDFAIVGLAGSFRLRSSRLEDAQLVFFGCEDSPRRALGAAAALEGRRWNDETRRDLRRAVMEELQPMESIQASGPYRARLAQIIVVRALDRVQLPVGEVGDAALQ